MDERANQSKKEQKRGSWSSRYALRESKERLDLALEAEKLGTFLSFPLEDRSEPDVRTRALFGLPQDETLIPPRYTQKPSIRTTTSVTPMP
jgi:hypothetical protein